MNITQAVTFLTNHGFSVLEPINFNRYDITLPDGSQMWSSLSDREVIMFAEGVKWALSI